jgi:hypothetical protein
MMDDREFDELVKTMQNRHNPPPETPRDRMWERIDAARADRRARRRGILRPGFRTRPPFSSRRLWLQFGAAAAVLVLGIAIGRMTLPGGSPREPLPGGVARSGSADPARPETVRPADTRNLLYSKAAADLFGRADALLTDFQVSGCSQQDLAQVPDWAGGMLVQTRLLLGTPVGHGPEMRELLLDLELVLAQIVGLSKDNCARDAAWIRDALTQKSTIDRMRLLQPDLAAGKLAGKAI